MGGGPEKTKKLVWTEHKKNLTNDPFVKNPFSGVMIPGPNEHHLVVNSTKGETKVGGMI